MNARSFHRIVFATALGAGGVFGLNALDALAPAQALAGPPADPKKDGDLTGRQIAERALNNNALGLDEAVARVKMVIHKDGAPDRLRVIDSKAKKGSDKLSRNYIRFEEPPDVRGTSFLNLEQPGGDTTQVIYLPAAKKTRRIASNKRGDSFMGSDFSYKDMEVRKIDDGTYTRLPDEKVSGQDCWVIESKPVKADDDAYSKTVSWIDKTREVPLRVDFYGKDGQLLKQLKVKKFRDMVKKGETRKRWIAIESTMSNVQNKSSTDLTVESISFDEVVGDDVFTEQFLQRG